MDPPSEVCARTGSALPCPTVPESRRPASPFGAAVTVRRTEIWFTWPSGACSPFGAASSSLPRGSGTCCLGNDPPLPMLLALGHGPRHASTSSGATCGGKNSGRSRGSLAVHCCPPRPWAASPQPGPRGPSTGPLATTFVVVRATLLTLAPTIRRVPVLATRPQSRVSSLGVVQRSPLHRLGRGIRLPETVLCVATAPGALRDGNANSHPRAAHVVFHHLDGLFLLDPATVLQAAADPGVHRVSSCRETGFPAVHLLPFEAFPPPTATATETNLGRRGLASPLRPFPASAFTAHLPFTPFLPRRASAAVSRRLLASRARTSRSCSIVGSVVRPAVSVRTHPVLPWACPTRPPERPSDASPRERGKAARKDHANELSALRQRPLRRALSSV
jgi:hypothetical protein